MLPRMVDMKLVFINLCRLTVFMKMVEWFFKMEMHFVLTPSYIAQGTLSILHVVSLSIEDPNLVKWKKVEAILTSICSFSRYKYEFPFLETNGEVTVDDNRVGPLYKHVFPPALAPWLSFVGLPWKVIPTRINTCSSSFPWNKSQTSLF